MLTFPMDYFPTADELEILGGSPILVKLNKAALLAVAQAATLHTVKRGGFLFHQGEPATSFFVLLDGKARLSQIAEDGRQVIFHYFGPGEAMGVVVVLANAAYPVSAEAISDSIALGWDRQTAFELMEQYPRMAINGMELVAGRFWELQNRYRELATERVEQRLARAVLRLAAHMNGQAGGDGSPTLALSRQDLAEMTGTTLFTVSRICSDWEQHGILSTGREQITLLNKVDLDTIANDLPNS